MVMGIHETNQEIYGDTEYVNLLTCSQESAVGPHTELRSDW